MTAYVLRTEPACWVYGPAQDIFVQRNTEHAYALRAFQQLVVHRAPTTVPFVELAPFQITIHGFGVTINGTAVTITPHVIPMTLAGAPLTVNGTPLTITL